MLPLKRMCQAAFVSLLAFSAASAETITFSGITTNRSTFSTYTEGNYTVTAVSGEWLTNTSNYGDPVPSIFDEHTMDASIDITNNAAALFSFSGVDLGNFENVDESYTITGYLAGVEAFSTTGNLQSTNGFVDYGTGYSGDVLSKLVITLSGNSESNVDNIVVNDYTVAATPEPESLELVLSGAAGMAAVLRRRLRGGFTR